MHRIDPPPGSSPFTRLLASLRQLSLACVRPRFFDLRFNESGGRPSVATGPPIPGRQRDGPCSLDAVVAAAATMEREQFAVLSLSLRQGFSHADMAMILATGQRQARGRTSRAEQEFCRALRTGQRNGGHAIGGPGHPGPSLAITGAASRASPPDGLVGRLRRAWPRGRVRAGPLDLFASLPLIAAPPGLKQEILDRVKARQVAGSATAAASPPVEPRAPPGGLFPGPYG